MSRIYLASSWRNLEQPSVVGLLRAAGHEVYDFRNPRPGDSGFSWSEIDPEWQSWCADDFRAALDDPIAIAGYTSDMDALRAADTCVLLLPCGRSAHLELGWAVGHGRRTVIVLAEDNEPELMYRMVDYVCTDTQDLLAVLVTDQHAGAGDGRRRPDGGTDSNPDLPLAGVEGEEQA